MKIKIRNKIEVSIVNLPFIIAVGILLVFASCSGVKNLTQPVIPIPSSLGGEEPFDSLTIADLGWWEFYGDEYLKEIIDSVLHNNKGLEMASARVQQARYLYDVDKASLLPELSFKLPWNHETNDYYKELSLIDPEIGVKASISWEVDLFGSLRWNKKKSEAQFHSAQQDERAMRMVLVAETASAYFRLVALDNELAIVKSTMSTREEGVRLAKLRFDGGLTSETVYQQAQVQYATAAALIPNLEYNIKVAENQLLLLMGSLPDQRVARASSLKDNSLPERIPLGIPSSLLERRPDVRALEDKLRAAVANVGYTYAKRFPSLNIELTGGLEDNDFKNLFRSPFSYVAENFVAPLFDFGKRKKRYQAAIAAYDEARLSYENKVLEAFAEVDNALMRYNSARMAVTKDTELLEAAHKYQELTWKQYRGGTINYIDVLDAQRRFFEAQISRMNAIRDEHLALIQLYKALGGGWQLFSATSK
ncbi:MAG: TolC family protein [Muribaculaceae bacterium]|nr:TolC family protein [Muribaculaceae bacterium]